MRVDAVTLALGCLALALFTVAVDLAGTWYGPGWGWGTAALAVVGSVVIYRREAHRSRKDPR